MKAQAKTFTAEYRYRINKEGPYTNYVDIKAISLKEAKQIAKGLEGREDDKTWLMGIQKKEEL